LIDLSQLPPGLPIPEDDGGAQHLTGSVVPSVRLSSTSHQAVDLSAQSGTVVLYCFPMLGAPGAALPPGWDEIPGARGCTPESCSFRDHHEELGGMGVRVFGLSSQGQAEQQRAVERLNLPFELLSDSQSFFSAALALPCFQIDGVSYIKRLTLVIEASRVSKVFYPIFPPDKHIFDVLNWLSNRE
jgi:peroxiredoxin